jgi:hypothetical protein
VIGGLDLCVADDMTIIQCATLADRLAILDALMGALRWVVTDIGLPATIRVTDRPPKGLHPPGGGNLAFDGVPLSP